MCIFLLQWSARTREWTQEWTGDENFADIEVCHMSSIQLMHMQLPFIILCYFWFEPTSNPRVLVGVSPLTTSNPSCAAEPLILLPVSAPGRVSFKTEVTTGRIPGCYGSLALNDPLCDEWGGKAGAIQHCHYREVAALGRRAAHART